MSYDLKQFLIDVIDGKYSKEKPVDLSDGKQETGSLKTPAKRKRTPSEAEGRAGLKHEDNATCNLDFRWTPVVQDQKVLLGEVQPKLLEFFKKQNCSYTFQLEKGEKAGKYHFQCALHIKPKVRPSTFVQRVKGKFEGNFHCAYLHCQEVYELYCSKPERVEGPWTSHVKYVGQDLFDKPFKWQQEIIDNCDKPFEKRIIHWVFDPVGGVGKTDLCKWLMVHRKFPAFGYQAASNILSVFMKYCDKDPSKVPSAITFNLTRAKSSIFGTQELYMSLEAIKDGLIMDGKYEGGCMSFMPPHVWVFANILPAFKHMSVGRLKVWTIDKEKDMLVPWVKSQKKISIDE